MFCWDMIGILKFGGLIEIFENEVLKREGEGWWILEVEVEERRFLS